MLTAMKILSFFYNTSESNDITIYEFPILPTCALPIGSQIQTKGSKLGTIQNVSHKYFLKLNQCTCILEKLNPTVNEDSSTFLYGK